MPNLACCSVAQQARTQPPRRSLGCWTGVGTKASLSHQGRDHVARVHAVKAPALRYGDTIGIVAPSWCGPAVFPHRVERGVQFLEAEGYRVVLGAHAKGRDGYISGAPADRVADIHQFFVDPDVRAIVAAIGGDHSCQLLPLLDFETIRAHPTIFMGYSDISVLNVAIQAMTGLVTFNGPALMTDLAEFPVPYPYTVSSMVRTLRDARPFGRVLPAAEWTEEILDWDKQLDLTRPRATVPSSGWAWIKGGARGRPPGRRVHGIFAASQGDAVLARPGWGDPLPGNL